MQISPEFFTKRDCIMEDLFCRTLWTSEVEKVKSYIHHLENYMKGHNIEEKLEQCRKEIGGNKKGKMELRIQGIQEQIVRGQKYAEKKCGKKRQKFSFSPMLSKAIYAIIMWRQLLHSFVYNKIPDRRTQLWITKNNLKEDEWSHDSILKGLKKSKKELKKIKMIAQAHRENFLISRAAYYAEIHKIKESQIIQNIQNGEKTREVFRRLKPIYRGESARNITYITKENEAGEIMTPCTGRDR